VQGLLYLIFSYLARFVQRSLLITGLLRVMLFCQILAI